MDNETLLIHASASSFYCCLFKVYNSIDFPPAVTVYLNCLFMRLLEGIIIEAIGLVGMCQAL